MMTNDLVVLLPITIVCVIFMIAAVVLKTTGKRSHRKQPPLPFDKTRGAL